MKIHTEEEIKAKIEELWGFGPEILTVRKNHVRITMEGMYRAPGLTFKQLMALAEFFETDNINEGDFSYRGGCETCDYGSAMEWTLEILPGNWPIKSQG